MKLRNKVILVGIAGVAVATVVTVRAIKRMTSRVINRAMRRVLADVVAMKGEDFIPGGALGQSLFIRRIEKLDTKQLAFLCALVQVGYFIKVSEINTAHPTSEQIRRAINKLNIEERLAPTTREEALDALNSSDVHDALAAAFGVLGQA